MVCIIYEAQQRIQLCQVRVNNVEKDTTLLVFFLSLKVRPAMRFSPFAFGLPYLLIELICVGCYVHYWVSCAIYKGGFLRLHVRRRRRHTFASLWGACLRFASLWRVTHVGILVSSAFIFKKVCWIFREAYIDLCLLNRPKPSSFRSLLLNFTLY